MSETLDLVWGAAHIAALIGKTDRATFQMLERGQIPGAKKIGRQWVLNVRVFRASFGEKVA